MNSKHLLNVLEKILEPLSFAVFAYIMYRVFAHEFLCFRIILLSISMSAPLIESILSPFR